MIYDILSICKFYRMTYKKEDCKMKISKKCLLFVILLMTIFILIGCKTPCDHENTRNEITATCIEDGFDKTICEDCGELLEESWEVALGHMFSDWTETKSASCTEDGEKRRTCRRENCMYYETLVIPSSHDWGFGFVTKHATCIEDGEREYSCNREGCNETKTEVIRATGHFYSLTKTVKPTCEESGYDLYTCSDCGVQKKGNIVPKYGHIVPNGVCSRCNKVINCSFEGGGCDDCGSYKYSGTQIKAYIFKSPEDSFSGRYSISYFSFSGSSVSKNLNELIQLKTKYRNSGVLNYSRERSGVNDSRYRYNGEKITLNTYMSPIYIMLK